MANDMQLEYHVTADTASVLNLPKVVEGAEKKVVKSFDKMDKAVDRFGNELTDSDKKMGRFIDKSGKMRESNGRFVKGLEKTADSTSKSTFHLNKLASAIGGVIVAQQLMSKIMSASNTGRDFEASMADLSAITGSTGEDLKFLSNEAKRLGGTTKFTASQVAESFKLMASAKPDLLENADALSKVTEQALLLATASGVDLVDATSTVGGALNQFGESSDQAARYVNVLAAGAKLGASEVTDTAEALKNSGVAAASAKISFEEANAAIQVLSLSSIKGAEAGTALRNIFLKLETSTDQNLKPSIVGLNQSLSNLEGQGLSSAEMVKMFGLENITAATALLNSREKVEGLTTALTGTNVASEQAAIKADTLKNAELELASAVEGLQIALAESANPALREFYEWVTKAAQGATFFWQSLNEGTLQNITSEMADVNDEIKRLRANLAGDGGFFDSGLFYDENARKQDEHNLAVAESKLETLREKYKTAAGLTPPPVNPPLNPASGGSTPPTIPSSTPTVGLTKNQKKKDIDRGVTINDLGLESTATGMSNAIIAENETVFDELNRQRDLIKEFQDLEIGDAEAHSAALIAIDQKEADEKRKIDAMIYSSAADGFGAMADLVGAFAGESSSAYKALFAVSKSFAIANAAIQLQTAISNASALPYPANLPAIGQAVAAGSQIASTIASVSYGGGRRYGGGVSAGRMYEVGESGAEMFTSGGKNFMIPGKDGSVTSNSNMGGGGVNIVQNFNVEASATYDQNAMAQLMSATKNQTLAIMQEQSRPGGMIAK